MTEKDWEKWDKEIEADSRAGRLDFTTGRFWSCFARLPEGVQKVARQNFELLKANPSHSSLHFKKVGELWSVRVGLNHRALGVEDAADIIWVWIGLMTSTSE